MPRWFEPFMSPTLPPEREKDRRRGPSPDDDAALGWESANPFLQFEAWEPSPERPPAGPAG